MAEHLGFHSLTDEVDRTLDVEGDLPGWLSGTLIRNGPGAFELGESAVDHWFDGLAMLHAFTFDGGVRYRNRFLRTEAYEAAVDGAFEAGFATGGSSLVGRLKQLLFEDPYDNTNVVAERVGDTHVAMTETPRWVAFDPDTLETRGHVQYDGPAPSGQLSCAHLRRDPETDRLVNFETAFGRTCKYHVHELVAPDDREHVASVDVDEPAYMHSFALTQNYVVLTEFPFVVDPMQFLMPGNQGPFVEQFEWKPERGTRFLVVDREAGEVVAEPRADAFFGFHHVNAYEADDGELVIDLETVPSADAIEALYIEALRAGELDALAGRLERFRVDIEAGTVERRELYDGGTALPTVPPERWTRRHRYVYAQATDRPVTEWPRRLVKIDAETGEGQEFADGGNNLSEPIFVPNPDDEAAEDDGVVLSVALNHEAERSELVVLDGETMTERARAPLPHPVPFDFHGRYFPELTS